MKTTTLLAAATTSLSLASASISGFAVPSKIAPDSDVEIIITTQGNIQAMQDVAMSFGLSPANDFYPGSLGTLLSTKFLGPDASNTDQNITHIVHIPATQERGKVVLQAAWFGLTGASTSAAFTIYGANITVGKTTSSRYVASEFMGNACQ